MCEYFMNNLWVSIVYLWISHWYLWIMHGESEKLSVCFVRLPPAVFLQKTTLFLKAQKYKTEAHETKETRAEKL